MSWKKVPLTRSGLTRQLKRNCGREFGDRLAPHALPAIRLLNGAVGLEPTIFGTTRFGGRPDLPLSVSWPLGPHGPLAFLGQLSLRELAHLDVDSVLPSGGLVSFFFNIQDYAWGNCPQDRERFAVLFTPREEELFRRDFPDNIRDTNRCPRCRPVTPFLRWQLPVADPLTLESLHVGEQPTLGSPDADPFTHAYWHTEFDLYGSARSDYQALGWANGIYQQGEDCRLKCALASRGFPKSDSPEHDAAQADRGKWRCLLEVGDDSDVFDDSWGDGGTIAFMICDEDLAAQRFDACWCVLSSS